MNQLDLLAKIIKTRSWRNGALEELADVVLRGEQITREHTDLTEKEWEKLFK